MIWCSSEWNLLDVTYLTFGIVAFFFSISQGWPMVFARALYGITSILMWIRLLRFYLASEKLGSMWIMIRRMLWETIIFMTHMGIMILASGISLYCINYRLVSIALISVFFSLDFMNERSHNTLPVRSVCIYEDFQSYLKKVIIMKSPKKFLNAPKFKSFKLALFWHNFSMLW